VSSRHWSQSIRGPFSAPGRGRPGACENQIVTEVEVPSRSGDLATPTMNTPGGQRERAPLDPTGGFPIPCVRLGVCEVLSPSKTTSTGESKRIFHARQAPALLGVDPRRDAHRLSTLEPSLTTSTILTHTKAIRFAHEHSTLRELVVGVTISGEEPVE